MAGRRQISSSRASGSRECAPDDKLREAIQISAKQSRFRIGGGVNGLLRRVAPRNDGGGGAHDQGSALNTRPCCPLPCWSARDRDFSRSCPAQAQNPCAPARKGRTGSPALCASAAGSALRTAPCPFVSCAAGIL